MKSEQPIVDLSYICKKAGEVSEQDWINVADQLRYAFGKFGYCYLVNHGIPEEIVRYIVQQSHTFSFSNAILKCA